MWATGRAVMWAVAAPCAASAAALLFLVLVGMDTADLVVAVVLAIPALIGLALHTYTLLQEPNADPDESTPCDD